MLGRVSSAELTEWAAYETLSGPLDVRHRVDVAGGIVAATVANANRAKRARTYRPEDFMPEWGRGAVQTPQQMSTMLMSLTVRMGGTVRSDGDDEE